MKNKLLLAVGTVSAFLIGFSVGRQTQGLRNTPDLSYSERYREYNDGVPVRFLSLIDCEKTIQEFATSTAKDAQEFRTLVAEESSIIDCKERYEKDE